jgi:mono/diheme cytochrome c family protein
VARLGLAWMTLTLCLAAAGTSPRNPSPASAPSGSGTIAAGGATKTAGVGGASAAPAPTVAYRDVARIFAFHCSSCHGPDGDNDWWSAGFADRRHVNTRSYADVIAQTDLGRTVQAGKPDRSRLYTVLFEKDEGNRMPLFGKALSDADKKLIRQWIVDGAVDSKEEPPAALRVPLTRTTVAPPITQERLDAMYETCRQSMHGVDPWRSIERVVPSPPCRTFQDRLHAYRSWQWANDLEVSCRIDTEAYVDLTFSAAGNVLARRVATFKQEHDYGDKASPGEWFTWSQPAADWPSAVLIELAIRYWKPGSPAVFLVSFGSLPEEARKIAFSPNPLHGAPKGRLDLWLAHRSDATLTLVRNFSDAPATTTQYTDLPSGLNAIDVRMKTGETAATGLHTLLVNVVPRGKGAVGYSAAVAIWID